MTRIFLWCTADFDQSCTIAIPGIQNSIKPKSRKKIKETDNLLEVNYFRKEDFWDNPQDIKGKRTKKKKKEKIDVSERKWWKR
jgi:hypothetical protein